MRISQSLPQSEGSVWSHPTSVGAQFLDWSERHDGGRATLNSSSPKHSTTNSQTSVWSSEQIKLNMLPEDALSSRRPRSNTTTQDQTWPPERNLRLASKASELLTFQTLLSKPYNFYKNLTHIKVELKLFPTAEEKQTR